jgi:hypothetical protein
MESVGHVKTIHQLLAFRQDEGIALVFGQLVLRIADITSSGTEDEITPQSGLDEHAFAQFRVWGGEDCAGCQGTRALGRPLQEQIPKRVQKCSEK